PNRIVLFVDGVEQQRCCYLLSEDKIKGSLRNGAVIPWSRSSRYYIIDNNKRYAHVYIKPNEIGFSLGSRVGIQARYDSNCLGKRQRKHWQECRKIRTERRRKLRERNRRKRQQELQPEFGFFKQWQQGKARKPLKTRMNGGSS